MAALPSPIALAALALLAPLAALACPGCAGSMENPKDARTVFILAGFIVLTALPFWLLYSTIHKHRNINRDDQRP